MGNIALTSSKAKGSFFSLAAGLFLIVGVCTTIYSPIPLSHSFQQEISGASFKIIKETEVLHLIKVSTKDSIPHDKPQSQLLPDSSLDPIQPGTTGKSVYQEHCANCHGIEGDGQGPNASDLSTRPQNFIKGVYKFRSTPSGELPADADLLRTISNGIPGTAMAGYEDLSSADRIALVAYLKFLSPRFLKKKPGTPILYPQARPLTSESAVRGKHLFEQMVCAACHGATGKGDGELAQELTNTAGEPIRPADLTQRKLKSGVGPKAIYRTIMTGLDGTPMPSYGDSLSPDEGWDLALYIYSLAEPKEPS